jgi:hypothetical protein
MAERGYKLLEAIQRIPGQRPYRPSAGEVGFGPVALLWWSCAPYQM